MLPPTFPPQDTAGNTRSVALIFLYQKSMASVIISVNWPGYIGCVHTISFKEYIIPPLLPAHNSVTSLQPKSARKIPQPSFLLSHLTLLNIVIFI